MPLTFPSHAAAIIPLLHLRWMRRLLPSALVVGSTAPDLIYLIGTLGEDAHLPWGLLSFCLPAGLLAFLYLEAVLLPALGTLLVALLPRTWQRVGVLLLSPRPLPRQLTGWLAVCLAILLGAVTHQLWDGFTHAWMWPARTLYPGLKVGPPGHPVLLSKILQHLSSALGVGAVVFYLSWVRSRLPTTSEPPQGDRAGAARRLLRLVLIPLIGGTVAGLVRLHHPHPLITRAIWDAAWAAVAWFLLLLGATCLLGRARHRLEDTTQVPREASPRRCQRRTRT